MEKTKSSITILFIITDYILGNAVIEREQKYTLLENKFNYPKRGVYQGNVKTIHRVNNPANKLVK